MCLIKLFKKKKQTQQQEEVTQNLYIVEYIDANLIKTKDLNSIKGIPIGIVAINEEDAKRKLAKKIFEANDVDIITDKNGIITSCISRVYDEYMGIQIHTKYRFLRVKFIRKD